MLEVNGGEPFDEPFDPFGLERADPLRLLRDDRSAAVATSASVPDDEVEKATRIAGLKNQSCGRMW